MMDEKLYIAKEISRIRKYLAKIEDGVKLNESEFELFQMEKYLQKANRILYEGYHQYVHIKQPYPKNRKKPKGDE